MINVALDSDTGCINSAEKHRYRLSHVVLNTVCKDRTLSRHDEAAVAHSRAAEWRPRALY